MKWFLPENIEIIKKLVIAIKLKDFVYLHCLKMRLEEKSIVNKALKMSFICKN